MRQTDRRYLLGYPRVALGVLGRELAAHAFVTVFFLVAPALAAWSVFQDPSRRKWQIPAAFVLSFVAFGSLLAETYSLLTRFGLRLVPRFDRRLEESPGTYSYGRSLVGRLEALDRLAEARGAATLSDFGAGEPDQETGGAWFDCGKGRAVVAALIDAARGEGMGRKVEADLERIGAALAAGEAAGARFRLAVVAGDSMNAMFYDWLREHGY